MKFLRNISVCIFSFAFANAGLAEPKTTAELLRGQLYVDPDKTGETIVDTLEAGEWKEKGLKGSFRFKVTESDVIDNKNAANKLYVQWIRENGEIAYSMSIRELNQRPEYEFSKPVCHNKSSCTVVTVNATHQYERYSRRFIIKFPSLGKYSFTSND